MYKVADDDVNVIINMGIKRQNVFILRPAFLLLYLAPNKIIKKFLDSRENPGMSH